MKSKYLITLFALFFIGILNSVEAFSQKSFKFGKYDQTEIDLIQCDFEPDAESVILFHIGESNFINGHLYTNFHTRKKVLKQSNKDIGNVVVRYYSGQEGIETIKNIKAQLVNFENGQEEIFKLGKNEIFEVDLPNGFKEVRLTFPQVKVGSIIEYTYDKIDKYITFVDGWTFQNTDPTLFSRYTIGIPETLNYQLLGQGDQLSQTEQKFTNDGKYYWELVNLYSIKEEPYMSNFLDYVERIEFQLSSYYGVKSENYKNKDLDYIDVLNSWEKAGDDVLNATNYYSFLRAKNGQEILLGETFEGKTQLEQAKQIQKFIQNNFSISNKNGIIPSQILKDVLTTKVGTKADINLLMMNLLQVNGIDAKPVLISSKGNGRNQLVKYPFISQFNQLIIQAEIDNSIIFLDASDPNLLPGYLSVDNHVKQGFLLEKEKSKLVDINIKHKSGISQMTSVNFIDNKIIYDQNLRLTDYELLNLKGKYNTEESIKINHFIQAKTGEIKDFSIIENNKNLQFDIKFKYEESYNHTAEFIYLTPFQFLKFDTNPFKQEYRIFPVDFNYVFVDKFNAIINIPEGYEIDQAPKALNLSMVEGDIKFNYNINQIGNVVTLNVIFDMNKPLISAYKYEELKIIFDMIIQKFNEPIVFKKV